MTKILWEKIINDVDQGGLDQKLEPLINEIKFYIRANNLSGDIKIKVELKWLTIQEAKIQLWLKGIEGK